MNRQYSSCSYCGSAVDEQHVSLEMWFGDKLVVFEGVPCGVCDNCGEEYFSADIQDKLISLTKKPHKKSMTVPVYQFSDPLTIAKSAAKQKRKEAAFDDTEPELHIVSDDELTDLMETNLEDWEEEK